MKKLWLTLESVSHHLSGVAYELPYPGRNPLKTILSHKIHWLTRIFLIAYKYTIKVENLQLRLEGWRVGMLEGWRDGRSEGWMIGRMKGLMVRDGLSAYACLTLEYYILAEYSQAGRLRVKRWNPVTTLGRVNHCK